MKLDIQKLKQAAQKATQGQWIVESQDCRWNVTDAEGVQVALAQQRTATRDDPKQADRTANAEFIALANPENVQVLISQRDALLSALTDALEWIDSVPSETALPAMPGFDRDEVNNLISSIKGGAE